MKDGYIVFTRANIGIQSWWISTKFIGANKYSFSHSYMFNINSIKLKFSDIKLKIIVNLILMLFSQNKKSQ